MLELVYKMESLKHIIRSNFTVILSNEIDEKIVTEMANYSTILIYKSEMIRDSITNNNETR